MDLKHSAKQQRGFASRSKSMACAVDPGEASIPRAAGRLVLLCLAAGLCIAPIRFFADSAAADEARFRDPLASGGHGPEMLRIPGGTFRMGCIPANGYQCVQGRPVHDVAVPAFALAVHETTFEEFDRFLARSGRKMPNEAGDNGWGRGRRPAINIRYRNAEAYAAWLSEQTGHSYRLPSEAEWEYAARAGTRTLWSWGNEVGSGRANCDGCGSRWDGDATAPVGSFAPNPWGLYDMHGNVWEMVRDCAHDGYRGAPADGSARLEPRRGIFGRREVDARGLCAKRMIRGGSWRWPVLSTQSAARIEMKQRTFGADGGFRVARDIRERTE